MSRDLKQGDGVFRATCGGLVVDYEQRLRAGPFELAAPQCVEWWIIGNIEAGGVGAPPSQNGDNLRRCRNEYAPQRYYIARLFIVPPRHACTGRRYRSPSPSASKLKDGEDPLSIAIPEFCASE